MAHVAKFNRSALGHMLKHYERSVTTGNYSNENIDSSKTELNYNLGPEHDNNYEFIKHRCDELNCLKRKDVNVMCDWVVTQPKDFPEDQSKEFFQETYNFLEDRYGKENVVSSYVHKDEVSPHMHFSFIPVVHDIKKDKDKISAKERINRIDLKTFHQDLEKHLEQGLGFKVNVLNEATRDGNKDVAELKQETALKKVKELNDITNLLSKDIKEIKGATNILDNIQVKKSLLGGKLSISEQDYNNLIALSKKGQANILENKQLIAKNRSLKNELDKSIAYAENMKKLANENYDLKLENQKLNSDINKLNKKFNIIEKAINRIGAIDEVNKEIETIKLNEFRSSSFER